MSLKFNPEGKKKWIIVNLTGNTYVRHSSHCLLLSLKLFKKIYK